MNESKIKILVVDDIPIILEVARSLLEENYSVHTCLSGDEAIQEITNYEFDLIFMDVHLPGMGGLEVTKKIRSMPKRSKIPIIGLTGYMSEEDREQCLNEGMNDILEKPFSEITFSEMIDKWLYSDSKKFDAFDKKPEDMSDGKFCKEINPLNYSKVLSEFDNNEALLHSIMEKFLLGVNDQLTKLAIAVKEKDRQTIKKNVHSIKCVASNMCAESLSKVAGIIESHCEESDIKNIQEEIDLLKNEFIRLKNYVERSLNIVLLLNK